MCLSLVACSGAPCPVDFHYADLRLLDPSDTQDMATDIIALYVNLHGDEVSIRLDLLEFSDVNHFDLYLALDTVPGGTNSLPLDGEADLAWDLLLRFPAVGNPEALSSELRTIPRLIPSINRQPQLDIVTIRLPARAIPPPDPFLLQAFTTQPGSLIIADRLGPVSSDALPPPKASLLLAFWNAFPAYTPALALRTWSSAHAGPGGERFGLLHLIEAVVSTEVPVTLLDVKASESLRGLEYLGHIQQLRELQRIGLLDFPDTLPTGFPISTQPEWVIRHAATSTRTRAMAYGFTASPVLALPSNPFDSDSLSDLEDMPYRMVFSPLPNDITLDSSTHLFHTDRLIIIPLPETDLERSVGHDHGLAVDWRRILLDQAISSDRTSLTVLGGDLQATFWADAIRAQDSLRWIASHPWIDPLTPTELIDRNFPSYALPDYTSPLLPPIDDHIPYSSGGQPIPSGFTVGQLQSKVLNSLASTPPGSLTEIAWQAYLAAIAGQTCGVIDPTISPNSWSGCEGEHIHPLLLLRANSLGRAGAPLAAVHWGQSVALNMETEAPRIYWVDLDWDGEDELVFSNRWLFAVLSAADGSLAWLFGYDPKRGPIQLIGSRSQFVIGLSDPSTWDPFAGELGEQSVPLLDGAFYLTQDTGVRLDIILQPNGLVIKHPDGSHSIQYVLDGRRLNVSINAPGKPLAFEVPLVFAPELMDTTGWASAYTGSAIEGEFRWGILNGPTIALTATVPLNFDSFLDFPASAMTAEDPNLDYPLGHYLPFPFALVTGQGFSNVEVDLLFEPGTN